MTYILNCIVYSFGSVLIDELSLDCKELLSEKGVTVVKEKRDFL